LDSALKFLSNIKVFVRVVKEKMTPGVRRKTENRKKKKKKKTTSS